MPRLRAVPALALALAAVAGLPATAPAASELFVQSARSATAVPQHGRILTLTLRGTPPTVLMFEDRPLRRSGRIPNDRYVALWADDFGRDAPNAALVGRTPDGRRTETVVVLLAARPTAGGTRYTIRAEHGRPPRRLRDVSLFVDPFVPVDAWSVPLVRIGPGAPYVLGESGRPGILLVGRMEFLPGASLVFHGTSMTMVVPGAATARAIAAASTPAPRDVADGYVRWQLPEPGPITVHPAAALVLSGATIGYTP